MRASDVHVVLRRNILAFGTRDLGAPPNLSPLRVPRQIVLHFIVLDIWALEDSKLSASKNETNTRI